MNSATPLDGGDRVKITIFFLILTVTIFFGVIPMLIALVGIYIMKKDKSFSPIIKSKKYIKVYLTLLALGATIIAAATFYDGNIRYFKEKISYSNEKLNYYNEKLKYSNEKLNYYNEKLENYDRKKKAADPLNTFNPFERARILGLRNDEIRKEIKKEEERRKQSHIEKVKKETAMIAGAGLVLTPIAVFLLMSLFSVLYFRPLEEHKEWVVNNGIFSDLKENEDGNSTGIMGRDKLSSFSVADELIKWNALLEKQLISQEEFDKAKQKLLNQK